MFILAPFMHYKCLWIDHAVSLYLLPTYVSLSMSVQFVFMARGKDTMVRENEREEITVSDGLQLGRTTIDQTEINTVESEVDHLKAENAKVLRHLHMM